MDWSKHANNVYDNTKVINPPKKDPPEKEELEKADEELYLKKYTKAVHAQEAAEVEKTVVSKPVEVLLNDPKKPEID